MVKLGLAGSKANTSAEKRSLGSRCCHFLQLGPRLNDGGAA